MPKSRMPPEERPVYYCARCGEVIWDRNITRDIKRGRAALCEDCRKFYPQWKRGRTYLCVVGEKPFLGGHFRKEEMEWSLRYGSWDPGMVFEEWNDGKYVRSWAVVTIDRPDSQRWAMLAGLAIEPEQALGPVARPPTGDGRLLVP